MELIHKYPEKAELIQLGDHCIWCWECFNFSAQYCNEKKLENWHEIDNMLTIILKEYSYLQISKLHDQEKIGDFNNHTIKYVINKIPDNKLLVAAFEKFRKDNWPFIKSMKHARNKTIAHNEVSDNQLDIRFGTFEYGEDIKYFNELHQLIDQMYKHEGLSLFSEWPEHTTQDIKSFINIIVGVQSY
ncbi:hypothetical protein Q4575_10790 [Psychrosphaera sp. 1_MG-2023]|uniref:AbiU2 domain-containing protein n=1 Tax=Psychrosphaera sp. 1_MG-2023 TaxID=3062643 RepID=UPI0026E378A8|nr:hypothetical protein [Psychrosphaera sp. 1_MG-2023]MDO6719891.1 hypothetical protein [Psychrosphaera sp. 1_MG-2023]